MEQSMVQYVRIALGRERASFFFFFGWKTFLHSQYINIMYALDSTQ